MIRSAYWRTASRILSRSSAALNGLAQLGRRSARNWSQKDDQLARVEQQYGIGTEREFSASAMISSIGSSDPRGLGTYILIP